MARDGKSGKKPNDIPSNPQKTYGKSGWAGMSDWFGTGKVAPGQHRPFKQARAFVHSLGLKSGTDWKAYCQSANKPSDIPNAPQSVYANDGWAGQGDWLGTGTIASFLRQYRSFEKARAFSRSLGLKSQNEWKDYCRSGEKPDDIPSKPDNGYADQGWAGMSDWLGYVR